MKPRRSLSICSPRPFIIELTCGIDMTSEMTNYLPFVKTTKTSCGHISCQYILSTMEERLKPFADIAERLKWHRKLEGLTQAEYAVKIGQKRATINNWESGDYRLSLDGALALRKKFGLSMDFMYEGIDDALPMTLRQLWRERPSVK